MLTKRECKTEPQQEQQTPHPKEVKKKQTVTSRNSGENFLSFIVVLCKTNLSEKNNYYFLQQSWSKLLPADLHVLTFFLRRIFVTLDNEIKKLSFLKKMGNQDTNITNIRQG